MKMLKLVASTLLLVAFGTSHAALIEYTANPTTNSSDWLSGVSGLGGTVNSNVDFDSHASGALNSSFYTATDGVTLTGTGLFTTVGDFQGSTGSSGPANGNDFTPPTSTGEGLNGVSNYLGPQNSATSLLNSTLLVDFSDSVLGFGITSIDLWDPNQATQLILEAFTGLGGTGSLLGTFTNAEFNFQNNYTYFMGFTSSDNDIRSVRVTHIQGGGDTIGLDNLVFATVQQVPEPSTLALFGLGLVGIGLARRRKHA